MKKLILINLMLCFAVFGNTQDLLNRIPSEADLVMEIRMDKLEKIYSHKKVFKSRMWLDLISKMKIRSMSETGIDFTEPGYFSFDLTDSTKYSSFHFQIVNEAKFLSFLEKESEYVKVFKNYKDSKWTLVQIKKDASFFIHKNTATLVFADLNRPYRRENQEYLLEKYYEEVREYESDYSQLRKIASIFARDRMFNLLNSNSTPFSSSICYKMITEGEEVNVWLNKLYSKLGHVFSRREFGPLVNLFDLFDANQVYTIATDPGKVELQSKIQFDQGENNELIQLRKGRKLRADFIQMVPEDYIGMYTLSYNTKPLYSWLKKIVFNTANNAIGGKFVKSETIQDVIDLLETLIDEDEIANLFSGDALFSLNSIEKHTKEFKAFHYTDDFERVDVLKKRTIDFPEVTLVIGVKNIRFFEKIISILDRENIVQKEGDFYTIPPSREFPTGIGIQLSNEKLILSNDFKLFELLAENKGYKTKIQNLNLSIYGHLNMDLLFGQIAQSTNNYYDYVIANTTKKYLKDIKLTSVEVENGLGIQGILSFNDQKQNAYISIIEMMDDLYQHNTGSRNEGRYKFYSEKLNKLLDKYEKLPAEERSETGDRFFVESKKLLGSKEAKESPYELKRMIRKMEDVLNGEDFYPEEHYEEYKEY